MTPLSYHSSNLSLIALDGMGLLVLIKLENCFQCHFPSISITKLHERTNYNKQINEKQIRQVREEKTIYRIMCHTDSKTQNLKYERSFW